MAEGSDFSFEKLSKAEAVERKQAKLEKLDPAFWDQLQGYLHALEQNLRAEQQRNPSSRKIALLADEFRNATRKCESFWETREKKITLHALKNSRVDGPQPPENATKAEQSLHGDLVEAFRKHVPKVVSALEKPSEAPPLPRFSAAIPPLPPATPVPAPSAPAMPQAAKPSSVEDSQTVRALVDMPPFVGLDGKTYRLKKGDVLTLPKKMVDMLAKRGQVAVMA